jgi:glycosyltransferase involved in cell wall biosynthesis
MQLELAIVIPCLNEARTLALCIAKAQAFLKEHDIAGEIIVADNGSRDALEWCIAVGMGSIVAGVVLGIMAARQCSLVGFGGLEAVWILRLVICSVLFLLLGGQMLLAGFYFGLMKLVAERRTRQLSSSGGATKSIRKTNEGAG